MRHQRVAVPGLKPLRQSQNALAALEEDFYGPAIAGNPDNLLVGKEDVGAQNGRSLTLRAALDVSHEHHLDRQERLSGVLPVAHLHKHGVEYVLYYEPLGDQLVQPRELHLVFRSILPALQKLYGVEVFDYGNGMDAFPA